MICTFRYVPFDMYLSIIWHSVYSLFSGNRQLSVYRRIFVKLVFFGQLTDPFKKTKQNFLDRAQKLYIQARNDDSPNVIGRILSKSISKFSADFYPFVAPLVYLGQFDPADGSHFTGIWEQGEIFGRNSVKLYYSETPE